MLNENYIVYQKKHRLGGNEMKKSIDKQYIIGLM